jgi:hypothetical protein
MVTLDANELVTIETYQNEIEAELAKGRLKGEGIKSFIFKDDCGGTRPHMQLTLGVFLKVRQIDLARASDILKSFRTSDRKSEEFKPGENKAALYSLLAWVLSLVGCGLLVISMSLGKAQFVIGIVILSAGILFGVSSRTLKKNIERK